MPVTSGEPSAHVLIAQGERHLAYNLVGPTRREVFEMNLFLADWNE